MTRLLTYALIAVMAAAPLGANAVRDRRIGPLHRESLADYEWITQWTLLPSGRMMLSGVVWERDGKAVRQATIPFTQRVNLNDWHERRIEVEDSFWSEAERRFRAGEIRLFWQHPAKR